MIQGLEQLLTPEKAFASRQRYVIVSIVSYLLGVPERFFVDTGDSLDIEMFRQIDKEKNAKIVRCLSTLRTKLERNYKGVTTALRYEGRGLTSIDDDFMKAIMALSSEGIDFLKGCKTTNDYIIQVNRLLSDRINNCKSLIPPWLNWDYVRSIFIMPDGLSESGIKIEAQVYYSNISFYPYQCYLNWPVSDQGNILLNDRKFVSLLYQWNNDEFTDYSKVSDASEETKDDIFDFLDESQRAVIVVDCENCDPYKFCASLRNIPSDKVKKIILFSDVHASATWEIIEDYTTVPVEYNEIERIKENKSLVDIKLTAESCREFYQNQVDSFVIASSDSDYWGLITSLPQARFLVMVESRKCGPDIKRAMEEAGIKYCYLDDFYTGDNEILTVALLREIRRYLAENVSLNVNEMIKDALFRIRAELTDAEKKSFMEKYIKPMHIVIEDDGQVRFELKSK